MTIQPPRHAAERTGEFHVVQAPSANYRTAFIMTIVAGMFLTLAAFVLGISVHVRGQGFSDWLTLGFVILGFGITYGFLAWNRHRAESTRCELLNTFEKVADIVMDSSDETLVALKITNETMQQLNNGLAAVVQLEESTRGRGNIRAMGTHRSEG